MLKIPISKGLGNCNEIKVAFLLKVLCRNENKTEIISINYPTVLLFMYILKGVHLKIWSTDGECGLLQPMFPALPQQT